MSKTKPELPILAFDSAEAWEAWLAQQPRTSPGVWLKFAKKSGAARTISKSQAIDGALMHGWIDGQLGLFDHQYFLTRFTPRKPKRRWSRLNRERAEKLIAEGRMAPAALAEVEAAKADGRWDAAYQPQSAAAVPEDLRQALTEAPAARDFFERLDGANRYAILYRLHHAKDLASRSARLAKFIAMLAAGKTIHPLKAKRAKKPD